MNLNWVVTGGNGFIGKNLVEFLLKHKNNVRVIDDFSVSTSPTNFLVDAVSPSEGSEWRQLEIFERNITVDCLGDALNGADVVVHLAASSGVKQSIDCPRGDFDTNVLGTFNVLQAATEAGISKFIFASSSAPLGQIIDLPVSENSLPRPISPYGASKLTGEAYCQAFSACYPINAVALRFSNIFGPWSDHKQSVVAQIIKSSLSGDSINIYGDGTASRDFLFVGDLVRAIVLAANPLVDAGVYQLGSGKETTISELLICIQRKLEGRGLRIPLVIHSQDRRGDIKNIYSDITKFQRLTNWQPIYLFEEAIEQTLEYFLGL